MKRDLCDESVRNHQKRQILEKYKAMFFISLTKQNKQKPKTQTHKQTATKKPENELSRL